MLNLGLIESLININEMGYKDIKRKQASINYLFPEFDDRVDAVAGRGGVRLKDVRPAVWHFKVHSGTKNSLWYDVYLNWTNLESQISRFARDRRLWKKDNKGVDLRKLGRELLMATDLEINCSCPAQLYWGGAYILTRRDAKYTEPENRPPDIRNPRQYGAHCFAGDTRVSLLDGGVPTIKDMAENKDKYVGKYTLSINPETLQLEPDKIVDVQKTRLNAQLVRVHLDNGKYVDCTPDHAFMLRDGSYKEAKDLQFQDSLMPLYQKVDQDNMKGYKRVYCPNDGRYRYIHSLVAKFMDGALPSGWVNHHKDFDKLNNDPGNLQRMVKQRHIDLHGASMRGKKKNYRIWSKGLTKEVDERLRCRGLRLKKKFLDGRLKIWNKGLTKETDDRVRMMYNKLRGCSLNHKEGCMCCICRVKRGEFNPGFQLGHIGFFRGKTKETSESVARMALTISQIMNSPLKRAELRKKALCIKRSSDGRFVKVLNHRVVKVEFLAKKADVYDLSLERNHNFPLEAGVFVHNCKHLQLVMDVLPMYVSTMASFLNHFYTRDIEKVEASIKKSWGIYARGAEFLKKKKDKEADLKKNTMVPKEEPETGEEEEEEDNEENK